MWYFACFVKCGINTARPMAFGSDSPAMRDTDTEVRGLSDESRNGKQVRAADRNRTLASDRDARTDDFLFPSVDEGVTLLDIEGDRGVPVVQSLVLDHLLLADGPAFWVDTNGYATTTSLARLAPSNRLLDRIRVARGFTAYQHFGLIDDLSRAVNQCLRATATTSDGGRSSAGRGHQSTTGPSMIVAPAVDARYRDDDTLRGETASTLLARGLARLRAYADGYDVPVLVTRSESDGFTEPIEQAADHYITCERTRFGPRFISEDFETLVYLVDDGSYYQTTFAYWRHVLATRAEQAGVEPTGQSDRNSPATVGTGVTVDGNHTAFEAAPLRDAWSGAGGGL